MNTGLGMTRRQAALVAGIAGFAPMLIGGIPFAEFYVLARLVVPGDTAETVRNILAHRGLFVAGLFAFLLTFIADVVIAWALYVLFASVHRALALLAAWFRLVFTTVALVALMHLVSAFRLIEEGVYGTAFGPDLLHAQVEMLIKSFRHEFGFSLVLFAIHLFLVGHLAIRSGFIPRVIGALVAIAGLGYAFHYLSPYLYPSLGTGFQIVAITGMGELVFAVWLLIRGRRIPEPAE